MVNKDKIKHWAFVGWAMYQKGKTKEELDEISGINLLILIDEFDRWLIENI